MDVRLLAVEIDERLAPIAQQFLAPYPKADVVVGDILQGKHALNPAILDLLPAHGDWHLVSNLPYSVSAPVLALCAGLEVPPCSLTVLIQDEVARRLQAQPATREWGPLTVSVAQTFEARKTRGLAPTLFWPRPKVQSTVLRLTRRAELPSPSQRQFLSAFAARVMRHRRQSLARVLRDLLGSREQAESVLADRCLQGDLRADTLGLESLRGLGESIREAGWTPDPS